jgi:hypothetical protein
MPLVHCSFNPLKAGRWLGMTKVGLMATCDWRLATDD